MVKDKHETTLICSSFGVLGVITFLFPFDLASFTYNPMNVYLGVRSTVFRGA